MTSFARCKAMVPVLLALALGQRGCDNNWNCWWVGTRTQWNVTKDFYMGLDVAYTKIGGMSDVGRVVPAIPRRIPGGYQPPTRPISDQDNWYGSASASIATSIRDRLIMDV